MNERSTATQTALERKEVKITEPRTLLERFNNLSEQISRRAYEIFEGKGRTFGQDLEDWFRAESEILHPVHLRVVEKDDALIRAMLRATPACHRFAVGNRWRKSNSHAQERNSGNQHSKDW
jgi:hypothetical protein